MCERASAYAHTHVHISAYNAHTQRASAHIYARMYVIKLVGTKRYSAFYYIYFIMYCNIKLLQGLSDEILADVYGIVLHWCSRLGSGT